MSSKLAKWYHSMTFTYADEWDLSTKKHGTVNTWDDWHLVPTSRPVFQQGDVKTVYVDIPGADGHIDLTESLSGYPVYQNRQGSLEFIVMNGYRSSWAAGFSKFANWLHGKKLRVVLDDDPSYFYEGRFKLNEWKSNNDGTWSNVTIDYNLKPYKYSITKSSDRWLWDPFNFETDIIYNLTGINVEGTTHIKIMNNAMHVVPEFKIWQFLSESMVAPSTTSAWKFILNGNEVTVSFSFKNNPEYIFKDPRLELQEGENDLVVIASEFAFLDITFRSGSL